MVSPIILIAIINAFMPVFHIHSDESYHSMWISEYMDCVNQTDPYTLTLMNQSCIYGNKHHMQILSNMVELVDDYGIVVTDIVYYVFYPYNGNIGIVDMGEHYYDMEHVTIRFQTSIEQMSNITMPYKVLYSIHSEYMWMNWTDTTHDAKLHVYVAKGSHASYPYAGTYIRYYGVANDKCDDGYTSYIINNIIYDPTNSIFQYTSVSDGDTGRNWNRREFKWGESPAYSSYSGSVKQLDHYTDDQLTTSITQLSILVIIISSVVGLAVISCAMILLCKSGK